MKRFLSVLLAGGIFCPLMAVELPGIFSDNAVFQRDSEIRIWGKGRPGEEVKVEFKGKEAAAVTGEDGKWMVALPALPASKEVAKMTVTGDNTLTRSNILVGDVWLCAGQSNMQWGLNGITGGPEIVAAAEKPLIRLFQIKTDWGRTPKEDVDSSWKYCFPETVKSFSAVGYLTGLKLSETLDVPVGLISMAWGGARIESMCAPESFKAAGVKEQEKAAFEKSIADFDNTKDEDLRKDKQRLPVALFNAMVHPVTPLSVRGMLWYQGEDNHYEGMAYAEKLKALAWTWRTYFKSPEMPIFLVMLPPWNYHGDTTGRLPRFWQAQQYFADHDKNAGIIVTTDCGNPEDIHPRDKAPLANRLANLVLYKEYKVGDDSALSPTVKSAVKRGGKVTVSFNLPNGLKTRDGAAVSHLELAGTDGKFHPATGVIEKDRLVVSSAEVAAPAKLRFGYDQVANPNLVNRAGLPVTPFEVEVK